MVGQLDKSREDIGHGLSVLKFPAEIYPDRFD
jgi:hypothetical protein